MAIEIKELIIRVTVNNSEPKTIVPSEASFTDFDKRALLKECVEVVLERLNTKIQR